MRAEEIYHFVERIRLSLIEETAERTVEKMLTAYKDTAPLAGDPDDADLKLLTLKEAAVFLGVSTNTFYKMRADGIIPVVHLGVTQLIDKADLIKVIQDNKDYGNKKGPR